METDIIMRSYVRCRWVIFLKGKYTDGLSVYRPGFGLDDRDSVPDRDVMGFFYLRHSVQTASSMGTGGPYSGKKATGT
jgi:hypothetical protein